MVVAEHMEELQGALSLEDWTELFRKHEPLMNLEKTEVIWVGKQRGVDHRAGRERY